MTYDQLEISFNIDNESKYEEVTDYLNEYAAEQSCIELLLEFNKPGDRTSKFDELRLIEPYLLSHEYKNAYIFVTIKNCSLGSGNREEWSVETYTRIQRKINTRVQIYWQEYDSLPRPIWNVKTNHGVLAPLIAIDNDTLKILSMKFNPLSVADVSPTLKLYHDLIKQIADAKITRGAKHLEGYVNQLRNELYKSDMFKAHLAQMPLLAQIIYFYFDYAYRNSAVKTLAVNYRNAIGKAKIYGDESTLFSGFFLKSDEWKLDDSMISALKKTDADEYKNQTFFNFSGSSLQEPEPHPFVYSAMTESCIIAENAVKHTTNENDAGIGLLSIHLRDIKRDKELLEKRYGEDYINSYLGDAKVGKFFFEIVIADRSQRSISNKFREYYADKPKPKGTTSECFDRINLDSFFDPTDDDYSFWDKFYSVTDNAINHFGLEIFNSVIKAKNGLFVCTSGNEPHFSSCTAKIREIIADGEVVTDSRKGGTTYSILLPSETADIPSELASELARTYDHVSIIIDRLNVNSLMDFDWNITAGNKQLQIEEIKKYLDGLCVNLSDLIVCGVSDDNEIKIERLVKAALWHLYDNKVESTDKIRRIAIIDFNDAQFLEIVRIIALYFNKNGRNLNMANREIYLHGKNASTELEIFGSDLATIREQMIRSAIVSGINPKFIEVLHLLLTRGGK